MNRALRILSLLLVLILALPLCAHAEETSESEWYLETSAALSGKLHEIIAFEGFAELFTGDPEIIDRIGSWAAVMDAEPLSVERYDLPTMELLAALVPEMEEIPAALTEKIERSLGAAFINQVNGRIGSNFLAASSMCVLSEGYLMPEGFTPCIVVYEYEEICLSVSFSQIGEGVVSATAQFTSPELIDLLNGSYEE